jgi:hypothetical protein
MSPDGRAVAATRVDAKTLNAGLRVIDLVRGGVSRLKAESAAPPIPILVAG